MQLIYLNILKKKCSYSAGHRAMKLTLWTTWNYWLYELT